MSSLLPAARAAALLAVLAAPTLAATARAADPAEIAGERYEAGSRALADRRFVEAALFFEAASAAHPNAVALYTAAQSWEQVGMMERAADAYARCNRTEGATPEQQSVAQGKLKQFEGYLGTLDVTAPDGWLVQLDTDSEFAAPAELHGTPGVHSLIVHAPDRPIERRSVVVAIGETQKIAIDATPPPDDAKPQKPAQAPREVEVSQPPPQAAPPPPQPAGPEVRRTVGLVTIGFGVAALAGGAVLGLQALDARDAYNTTPTRGGFDHASGLQDWTNIAFISGGVLTAAGVFLVWWPFKSKTESLPKEKEEAGRVELVPGLGGAALRGSF